MHQILIAEDDFNLQRSLAKSLTQLNCRLHQTHQVKRAFSLIDQHQYDLALIDRHLTDGDGLKIIDYLTQYSYNTRILVLSQLASDQQKVTGLQTGADDYLAKPFCLKELELKINKLLNMRKIFRPQSITLGSVKLYAQVGLLEVEHTKSKLRKKEAKILETLMINHKQTLSREQIINQIWSNKIPTYKTVDVYVRRLRQKLKSCSHYLKTVRGFGYCFSVPAEFAN